MLIETFKKIGKQILIIIFYSYFLYNTLSEYITYLNITDNKR